MLYKRYIILSLFLVFCILGTIAAFNYAIDPGNLFGKDQMLKRCGDWLLEGRAVAVTQNYDERLLQKYLIEHDKQSYDVIVIGSSRSMGIGRALFSEQSFKNYSVSGASLKDDVALYFLYEQWHGTPKKVIIGVDAWLLNCHRDESRWQSIADAYAYGKAKISRDEPGSGELFLEKYSQLISWPYLKASIEKVKRKRTADGSDGVFLVDNFERIPENAAVVLPDGSHIASTKEQTKDADAAAQQFIAKRIDALDNYDDSEKTEFRALISYLKKHDVEVVLYLTPYHPIAYLHMEQTERYQKALKTEQLVKELAAEGGIVVVGSYNPAQCGVFGTDFTDEMHLRREAVQRILEGKL